MYNALYPEGYLGGKTTMLHGIADQIEGPYSWDCLPPIGGTGGRHNPAFLTFPNESGGYSYSLWLGNGPVMLADSPKGPFTSIKGSFKGSNPAPVYHKGVFYVTTQHTQQIL